MPRDQHTGGVRHTETPRQIRRFTPQFAVDEIPEPAGQQTDSRQGREEVENVGHPLALDPREHDGRGEHSGHPTVEGHAAVPDMKDIEPILGNYVMAVKNAQTQSAADDDADGAVENEVVDIERRPGRAGSAGAVSRQPPRRGKSDEVHDPVPMDPQGSETEYRSDRDGDGVYMGVSQHVRYFRPSLTRQK